MNPLRSPLIRLASPADTPDLVALWLEASQRAHNFVPRDYWESQAGAMATTYLPQAESYVLCENDAVLGFISLVDDYLAALFVRPAEQGQGIGRRLMTHAQTLRAQLTLCVFVRNVSAVRFYVTAGFRAIETRRDAPTGEDELVMVWRRDV